MITPAPKPEPRSRSPRKPLRSTGRPKQQGAGGKKPASLARKPVRKVNRARKASEFKRCYHSRERVAFVKSLPCAVCRVEGRSQNAHLFGNDGMSRKGPYTEIAPLCGTNGYYVGCHSMWDESRGGLMWQFPKFDAVRAVRRTETLWQLHASGEAARANSEDSE